MKKIISQKISIVHFLFDSRVGGPQIFVDSLIKKFSNYSYFVFACGKSDKYTYLINLRIINKSLYPIEILLNLFIIYIKIFQIYRSSEIIFHVHGSFNIAPLIIARFMNLNVLWHLHEMNFNNEYIFKFLLKFLFSKKTMIAYVAKRIDKSFRLPSNSIYIPAGINMEFWNQNRDLSSNTFNTTIKILLISNISPIKGIDIFLKSLYNINTNKNIEVNIIGAKLLNHEHYYKFLLNITKRLPSNIIVNFIGWKNSFEVRSYLSNADIFVLPSISEACPISLLEALNMKVYSIATDVGDVNDMLNQYRFGYLVKKSSIDEFSTALNLVINKMLFIRYDSNNMKVKTWDINEIRIKTHNTYKLFTNQ